MEDSANTPPNPSPLTREVLSKYLGGDAGAGESLFSRFRTILLDRARRHSRMHPIQREVTPEDVVQEVFQRALASGLLARFEDRGRGSLEAALMQILERTMVDFARRLGAEKRGGGFARVDPVPVGDSRAAEFDGIASTETSPTGRAREHELVELARRALEPHEFEIWDLVELAGYDSNEVASRLHMTASAVRGVLFRAKAKLVRAIVGERDPDQLRS